MLGPSESLRQAVRNHLACWLVLKLNDAFLNLFKKEVELDVDVLCSCMEHWILRQRNATLIVFIDSRRCSKLEANVRQ